MPQAATNLGVAAEADLFEPPERQRLRDLPVAGPTELIWAKLEGREPDPGATLVPPASTMPATKGTRMVSGRFGQAACARAERAAGRDSSPVPTRTAATRAASAST